MHGTTPHVLRPFPCVAWGELDSHPIQFGHSRRRERSGRFEHPLDAAGNGRLNPFQLVGMHGHPFHGLPPYRVLSRGQACAQHYEPPREMRAKGWPLGFATDNATL